MHTLVYYYDTHDYKSITQFQYMHHNTLKELRLPASHFCIRVRPEIITDCAPGPIVEHLQTTTVDILFPIDQTNGFNIGINISSNIYMQQKFIVMIQLNVISR